MNHVEDGWDGELLEPDGPLRHGGGSQELVGCKDAEVKEELGDEKEQVDEPN